MYAGTANIYMNFTLSKMGCSSDHCVITMYTVIVLTIVFQEESLQSFLSVSLQWSFSFQFSSVSHSPTLREFLLFISMQRSLLLSSVFHH